MSFTVWITFVAAAFLIALSPGSGAVISMSHGLSYGLRKTSGTILGLQAGLLVILLIAGAGVGSILLASEVAFNIVKVAGALYLIYLGFSQWRSTTAVKPDTDTNTDTNAATATGNHAAAVPRAVPALRNRFLIGFLTNVTNPKGIIFMVAVLPQFITHRAPLLPQLLILALTMCSIDLLVMHSYALAASRMQRLLRNANAVKRQNQLFGGILIAVGTALFFVKRNPG